MNELHSVHDLEKYRYRLPEHAQCGWNRMDNEEQYMVPTEWFNNFADSLEDRAENASQQWHKIVQECSKNAGMGPQGRVYIGSYIANLEETVKDRISAETYCFELFENYDFDSDPKARAIVNKIIEATFKWNGWKRGHSMITLWTDRKVNFDNVKEESKKKFVKLVMEMNSWTDVVTNSSSELFVCESDVPSHVVLDMILDHANEYDEYGEAECNELDFDKIIRIIMTEDNEELMYGFELEDYGITEEDVRELEKLFCAYHGFNPNNHLLMLDIDHSADSTLDFVVDKLGAVYLMDC